ncbi:M23 family metallopeptidase [Pararhizobium sp. O133]|uniref:M23 family metallopeptidase n=1 Tax=Pararhizobium sp. O133 TaxID=3449278 RepID=UPI003F683CC2
MRKLKYIVFFIMASSAPTLNGFAIAQESSARVGLREVQFPSETTDQAPTVGDTRLQGLTNTLLPILIPGSFLKFETLRFVGDELSYTASARTNDAKISVSGTRAAIEAAPQMALPQQKDDITSINYGERSITAALSKNGAAYEITVECVKADNPKCNTDRYVLSLVEDLAFFGGGRGKPKDIVEQAQPIGTLVPFDTKFAFEPPGALLAGSGSGLKSDFIYAPWIRFPLEKGPAYLNSQVWNIGGNRGPAGSWKDKRNYQYKWRDNFCEARSRSTPACPSGSGHQGVDIRPADPKDQTYWTVATEDGKITNVGIYSVTLMGKSGTQYRYLHMKMSRLAVKQGDTVRQGQKIGLVSNDFGGTPTPVHLHFEMLQNVSGKGYRHVPPYTSLVRAYQQGT